jgi:hypothetical protein
MSVSFASDSNNEFIIENGEFVLVKDGAQVVQNVAERLRSYLDDFFLDRTQGVPYFQTILTKPFNLGLSESILKQTIIQTEDVLRLTRFESDFNPDTRALNVSMSFETTFGNVDGVTINV